MGHILGRIIAPAPASNEMGLLGYLVQDEESNLSGVYGLYIARNQDKFKNIEAVVDKDFGPVLKEKGISEDVMNYFTINGAFTGYPIPFYKIQRIKWGSGGFGSLVVLNKNMIGFSVLSMDGTIATISEQRLIEESRNIHLYNAVVRNNTIYMKSNYDVPDFRLYLYTYRPSDILVLDTETTGVCKDRQDEVLQLAIIDGNGKTVWNKYYKPENVKEWAGAMAVNHITTEMVANCTSIRKDIQQINKILSQAKLIVGYNTTFDLDKILKPVGIKWACRTEDIMKVFAPVYGEVSPYGTFKWKKLVFCAEYCGYKWGNDSAHDGLADCRATLHCYKALLNMWNGMK